jgi:nicotinamidase-related amidase
MHPLASFIVQDTVATALLAMGKTALVIVDCQNDFMPPDGALAVPNGDEVLPVIRGMLDRSKWDWDVVVATQVGERTPLRFT